MKRSSLILCILILVSWAPAYALVDLNVSYSYSQRKIDGPEPLEGGKQTSATSNTQGWSINVAWYIWAYTALELNYSRSLERLQDDRFSSEAGEEVSIKEVDSSVITDVKGVGIRQAFAPRKSLIVPSLAIGYAQLVTSGISSYILDDNGVEQRIELERDEEVFASGYISAQLRVRITELMGLTFSAKTVMPDFDTSKAENNLLYSAGFSWIF